MDSPLSDSTLTRAWRDTTNAWTGWRFWAAQVVALPVLSIFAVTLYPKHASSLQQAAIQGAILLGGEVLFAMLVLLAMFVAISPRSQRDEARTAAKRYEKNQVSHDELISARNALGKIIGDAGDQIACLPVGTWMEDSQRIFTSSLDLFRGPTRCLDESHVGGLYAAVTTARHTADGRYGKADILNMGANAVEAAIEKEVLMATIETLNVFIAEVNALLLNLPPPVLSTTKPQHGQA